VSTESGSDFEDTVDAIRSYFDGKRVDFKCIVDSGSAGDFDVSVWSAAREIGYGDVATYKWVARRIGRPNAQRAVGQALGRNPIPLIVPCHRVLRTDGQLGGFRYGFDWKRRLLDIERA
jgi:methylated-DNA-[protein]-cysteine S-methyltransferase